MKARQKFLATILVVLATVGMAGTASAQAMFGEDLSATYHEDSDEIEVTFGTTESYDNGTIALDGIDEPSMASETVTFSHEGDMPTIHTGYIDASDLEHISYNLTLEELKNSETTESVSGQVTQATITEPDTTAPSISEPYFSNLENTVRETNNVYIDGDEVAIEATIEDDQSGVDIDSIEATVTYADDSTESAEVSQSGSNTWEAAFNASGEVYNVEFTASDYDGNENVKAFSASKYPSWHEYVEQGGVTIDSTDVYNRAGEELTDVYEGDTIDIEITPNSSDSIHAVELDLSYPDSSETLDVSAPKSGDTYSDFISVENSSDMPESGSVEVTTEYGETATTDLDFSHLEFSEWSIISDAPANNSEMFGDWFTDSENLTVENGSVVFESDGDSAETIKFEAERLDRLETSIESTKYTSLDVVVRNYDSNDSVTDNTTISGVGDSVDLSSFSSNTDGPKYSVEFVASKSRANDTLELDSFSVYGSMPDSVGGIPSTPTGGFFGGIPFIGDAMDATVNVAVDTVKAVINLPMDLVDWISGLFGGGNGG